MKTLILDSQTLNAYSACGTQYYYRFIMNARRLGSNPAFDKGDLMHMMLKYHYKLIRHNQAANSEMVRRIPYDEIINISQKKAEKHLLSLKLPVAEGFEVIRSYREYAQYYSACTWQILEVEKPFAKILYEDSEVRIIYSGIIDLLTNMSVVDHKTYSRKSELVAISNQFLGYMWALGTHNIVINRIGFQKTVKADEKFLRPTLSFPQDIIDEWAKNTTRIALDLFRDYNDLPELQRRQNHSACVGNFGHFCEFYNICSVTSEVRDFILQKDYVIKEEWNPTKALR